MSAWGGKDFGFRDTRIGGRVSLNAETDPPATEDPPPPDEVDAPLETDVPIDTETEAPWNETAFD